jgi:YHS domain-containing protein
MPAPHDQQEENTMLTDAFSHKEPTIRFEFANWVGTDPLPRDRTQSHLLHEPKFRVDTIDPITGESIEDTTGHPSVVDGNLTIYFATPETRREYVEMPLNHPSPHLPFAASDEDDRGG